LSGHNHAYVRSYPMVGEKVVVDDGPIYLTIGTGGDSHSQGPLRPQPHDAADPWVAHRDNTEFGFGELLVVNATHAYFERILNNDGNNDDHDANPEARDAVWMTNHHRNTASARQQERAADGSRQVVRAGDVVGSRAALQQ
jgi:hypothetical protein